MLSDGAGKLLTQKVIQVLAGHQDLGTTQRYMDLSPAAFDAAIRGDSLVGDGNRHSPVDRGQ